MLKSSELRTLARSLHRPVLLLTLVYVLGYSAILRANIYYMDDLHRAATGIPGFQYYSRYLSGILSHILHAGSYLTDISPLPQLLAALLLALTGVLLLVCVSGKTAFSLWTLAAVLPLGLSPYFLECISYKYDSPYMALSLLAMVAPLLLRNRRWYVYCAAVFVGTVAMCSSYQASAGVLPMLTAVLLLLDWIRGKDGRSLLSFLVRSAGAYVLGLLVYHRFIMHYFVLYASTSTTPKDHLIPATIEHYGIFYRNILRDFKPLWLILIALLALAFLFFTVRDSRRNRFLSVLAALLTLAVMLLLCFGVYPLLDKPLYNPRAMYGFGALLAILAAVVATAEHNAPGKLVCLALSWVFFVFAFTYGNALSAQWDYAQLRMDAVAMDLSRLEEFTTEEDKIVQIRGSIGKAPILRNMPQDYQALNNLVPTFFDGSRELEKYAFYGYKDLRHVIWDDSTDFGDVELPVLIDTMYHTIRGDDTHILVELK